MDAAAELADEMYHNNECGAIFIQGGCFANKLSDLKSILVESFKQNPKLLAVFTEAVIESRGIQ